ncbi:MAG TPA: hypothetical protein DDY59_09235 [Lachnospiraceae bacterium]|nr:hypothetical protein [Lachnospiraceae bacterium]
MPRYIRFRANIIRREMHRPGMGWSMHKKINETIRKCAEILRLLYRCSKRYIIFTFIQAIISVVLPFINLYYASRIIDDIAYPNVKQETILNSILWMVGINLALSLMRMVSEKIQNAESRYVEDRVQENIGCKAMSMDYAAMGQKESRDLLVKAEKGYHSNGGVAYLCNDLSTLFQNILSMIYSIYLCFNLFTIHVGKENGMLAYFLNSVWCFILLMIIIGGCVYLTYRNAKTLSKITYKFFEENVDSNNKFGYYTDFLYEYKYGKDIRIYGMQKLINKEFKENNRNIKSSDTKRVKASVKNSVHNRLINGAVEMITYLYVGLKAVMKLITVGQLTFYVGVFKKLVDSVNSFAKTIVWVQLRCRYIGNYVEFLKLPAREDGSISLNPKEEKLDFEFKNVSFRYPGANHKALSNVSIKFGAGEKIAIVGRNGSGKSTFVKLLCRFYEPTEGEIRLNGINIKDYKKEDYWRLISAVFQDFKLFSFTMAENITISDDGDHARAFKCLKRAGLSELIGKLEHGIDTLLFHGMGSGIELSGGESQKTAIARAIYKNAPLMVLDEPTSALDPIAEYDIYKKFTELSKDKLTIFISHRLSSCLFGDKILVFENGEIVESGKHETLLSRGGVYYDLWQAQAQYYIS